MVRARNEGWCRGASACLVFAAAGAFAWSCTPFVGSAPPDAISMDTDPNDVADASVDNPCSAASDASSEASVLATSISAAAYHTCIIASDGSVWCWGANPRGQLGVPAECSPVCTTQACIDVGIRVPMLTSVQSVGVGGGHTCAVDASNVAWCWGSNANDELGTGPLVDMPTPQRVAQGFRTIAAGLYDTCVIHLANNAECWGANDVGQLGDGTHGPSRGPIDALLSFGGNSVRALFVGDRHACAIDTNDHVWCWGANDNGQLGIGAASGPESCNGTPCSTRPVQVLSDATTPLTRVASIAVGDAFTCAVMSSDGSVWCWGDNTSGQLGDGTNHTAHFPVRAGTIMGVSAIAAGSQHACAVIDSAVICWGSNSNGQLGADVATITGRSAPDMSATVLQNALQIAAGFAHTCAISMGAVYCWGYDAFGQLGDGSMNQRSTPGLVQFRR